MASEFRADPNQSWKTDLSDRHEDLGERLHEMLSNFQSGQSLTPLAVVGPYGSGKTQFMYEIYRRSWDAGIPAVYTDLQSVVEGYDEASDDISPTEWVDQQIDTEVESFCASGKANWIPNFRTETKREQFIDEFVPDKVPETNKRVLLIDEVEQKYTELEEYFDIDDDNPLRDILDKLSDVFQVWSFGLVSAYEVLGEADLRRFQEARIPISDIVTVEDQLRDTGRPTNLANGIWWLARGRFGWISKCMDKYPQTGSIDNETFTAWLDEVSDYSYYGADAINPVWTDVDGRQVQAAKRTIMFAEPAYTPWVVKGRDVIPTSTAHSEIMDGIRELANLKPDVYEIISANLRDVLQALSPPDNRPKEPDSTVNTYLPASAFNRTKHMQGLIDLVADFISSFEKRGDVRSNAVGILNEIDIERLTDNWTRIRQGIEQVAEGEPWTVNPSVVRRAFPPLALNPEVLTDTPTTELKKDMELPVKIRPEINLPGGSIEIRLCPTEEAFEEAQRELSSLADITRTTLLVVPDTKEEDDWDVQTHTERLVGLELVHITVGGSGRLWDFIIQLSEYLQGMEGYDGVLSNDFIQKQAIPAETQDEKRNTIKALFEEVRRITKNESRRAVDSFVSAYSLENTRTPIWEDEDLRGQTPFYAATGRGATWRVGLAYGIVFSEKSIGDIDISNLLQAITNAYEKEYIQQGNFGYRYLIRRMFDVDSGDLTSNIVEIRRKYGTDRGGLSQLLVRLRRALGYLCELNGVTPSKLYTRLRDSDTDTNEIPVLSQSQFNREQAPALCWGLLLSWCINDDSVHHSDVLDKTKESLSRLEDRVEDIVSQLDFLNERLEPPATIDLDNTVAIQMSQIQDYQRNVKTVFKGYDKLISDLSRFPNLQLATLLIDDIVKVYIKLFNNTLQSLHDTLSSIDLTSTIRDLQSDYRHLHSWIHDTNVNSMMNSVDKESLIKEIDELGQLIFDYKKIINSETIPLNELEVLIEVDEEVKADVTRLDSITERVESITQRRDSIENRSETIRSNLLIIGEQLQDVGDQA